MKTYTCPLGRIKELKHEHPERTAFKAGYGLFADYTFKEFPNRQSMAKCIRMQQKREHRQDDWKPIIPLTYGEGY
jgi:hypothetical protein